MFEQGERKATGGRGGELGLLFIQSRTTYFFFTQLTQPKIEPL